jgi:DNA polymerase elongation subunit (family B)
MTYPIIQEGEKIKFVYLKEPNPLANNTIAIGSILPEEFDLHRFVDYNKQFEKAFLDPIKTITDTIGWQLEKRFTIDDFF